MPTIKTVLHRITLLLPLLLLSGCPDGEDKGSTKAEDGDHIFKEQVRALEEAKEMKMMMDDATQKQRKALEGYR